MVNEVARRSSFIENNREELVIIYSFIQRVVTISPTVTEKRARDKEYGGAGNFLTGRPP